jgi:hypothetical protein
MKNLMKTLPFVLMIIGSFRWGKTYPIGEPLIFVIILIVISYISKKQFSFQKEFKIGTLVLASLIAITFLGKGLRMFNDYHWHINKDVLFERFAVAIGAGLLVYRNLMNKESTSKSAENNM